jgi:ATP-dependent helicase IRC3
VSAPTLRDYQHEALAAIDGAWASGLRRLLLALPTGTGKTVIFAECIRRNAGRSLVLVHTDELVRQALDKLALAGVTNVGVVKAERNEHDRPVLVASVQTLSRDARLAQVSRDFSLIVVDEAHHAVAETYRRTIETFGAFAEDGGPRLLGVTATPERGDEQGLDQIFQTIVFERDILCMIQAGYLCDLRGIRARLRGADFTSLHVRAGDFRSEEVADLLLDANAPLHIVNAYQAHAAGKRTLVFTPTVAVAHAVAKAFSERDITAESLDADTPIEERREMLKRFSAGDTLVIPNCNVLTEGFDEPQIEAIIIARPTRSRTLYTQMIGRGTRLFPGKAECVVIDLVGATDRHDLVTASSLFSMPLRSGESIMEAEERITNERKARIGYASRPDATLESSSVNLFRRRALQWYSARQGDFHVLSLGDRGEVRLVLSEFGWTAVWGKKKEENYRREILAEGVSIEYATGIAEDLARTFPECRHLVNPHAAWRNQPASEKQIEQILRIYPRRMPPADMTKSQAAAVLTIYYARKSEAMAARGYAR